MEKNKNIYELKFEQAITLGLFISDAAISVTEMYLAGKPARRGKNKLKAADRTSEFWSCDFLFTLSSEFYESEAFTLALTQYMEQGNTACFDLVHHIAKIAPETVRCAVRYSKLVQRQHSDRWKELEKIATIETEEFSELVKIFHTFAQANHEHISELEMYRTPLIELSPLELLTYASLYAFEYLIPKEFSQDKNSETNHKMQATWAAINDTLIWKLSTTEDTFLIERLGSHEMNLIAYMKATRTYLQLTEVYGLDKSIMIKTGLQVDLFRALLSLELMTAFYSVDYILPYQNFLTETGNSRQALGRLAMEGLIQGLKNRFPITWSDRQTKIKTIQPWTVSEDFPQGHPLATEAILDFWTNDLKALSSRQRNNES